MANTVKGSRGGGGYMQWTGPRRRQFEAYAAERGLSTDSYDANYGFLRHELTNTPEGAVLDKLRITDDVDEATRIFSSDFLRPGVPHIDKRISRARGYLGVQTASAGRRQTRRTSIIAAMA